MSKHCSGELQNTLGIVPTHYLSSSHDSPYKQIDVVSPIEDTALAGGMFYYMANSSHLEVLRAHTKDYLKERNTKLQPLPGILSSWGIFLKVRG